MELLGCHSNILWNIIYYKILDIISTKKEMRGIILCKNFDKINNDLLNKFYSYMQCLNHLNIKLVYILITDNISFIPNSIINQCRIISVPKPEKEIYKKIFNLELEYVNTNEINNIKGLITNNIFNEKKLYLDICNYIYDIKNIDYLILREKIYKILVYNLSIHDCIWTIFNNIVNKYNLSEEKISYLIDKIIYFFKYYNNNYRPIYHIEKIILEMCKVIHNM